jgi:hypothetical protein
MNKKNDKMILEIRNYHTPRPVFCPYQQLSRREENFYQNRRVQLRQQVDPVTDSKVNINNSLNQPMYLSLSQFTFSDNPRT